MSLVRVHKRVVVSMGGVLGLQYARTRTIGSDLFRISHAIRLTNLVEVWYIIAKRTAHSPLACYQPLPQARKRLTHLARYPHTQTRLGQSHCHTPPANEMRLSIRHA